MNYDQVLDCEIRVLGEKPITLYSDDEIRQRSRARSKTIGQLRFIASRPVANYPDRAIVEMDLALDVGTLSYSEQRDVLEATAEHLFSYLEVSNFSHFVERGPAYKLIVQVRKSSAAAIQAVGGFQTMRDIVFLRETVEGSLRHVLRHLGDDHASLAGASEALEAEISKLEAWPTVGHGARR